MLIKPSILNDALALLKRGYRFIANDAPPDSGFHYVSPRPEWLGFRQALDKAGAPMLGTTEAFGSRFIFNTESPIGFETLTAFELTPVSNAAMAAVATEAVGSAKLVFLTADGGSRCNALWASGDLGHYSNMALTDGGDSLAVTQTDNFTHPSPLAPALMAAARDNMSHISSYKTVCNFLPPLLTARLIADIAIAIRSRQIVFDEFADLSPAEAADMYIQQMAKPLKNPAAVIDVLASQALDITENTGVTLASVDRVRQSLELALLPPAPAPEPEAPPLITWADLSSVGGYIGQQKMSSGTSRLILLDELGRADKVQLEALGFSPLRAKHRVNDGIYYKTGSQGLKAKAVARAFGLPSCPSMQITPTDLAALIKTKVEAKFSANLNALMKSAQPLGVNMSGHQVYGSPDGRFFRLDDRVITEDSVEAQRYGDAAFLYANTPASMRLCADGFLLNIRNGAKMDSRQLQNFTRVILANNLSDFDASGDPAPSASQLRAVQEAIEASAYRHFAATANAPDEAAFNLGTDLYYGLPVAAQRTAESMYLQQYSTPIPMSVVAQRLLLGNDDVSNKTVLEPTAGNGGLLTLIPSSMKAFGLELDEKRVAELEETKRITARAGNALDTDFKRTFDQPDGFDYSIMNPPFGGMDVVRRFDDIINVRKLDHFIPLQAIAARKAIGRSVIILGADSPRSDGTLNDTSIRFHNYLRDHYEVMGEVEVDGRLYSRQGASFNVRFIVVGNRRPVPVELPELKKLPILTSYGDLWDWSTDVLATYDAANDFDDDLTVDLDQEAVADTILDAIDEPEDDFDIDVSPDLSNEDESISADQIAEAMDEPWRLSATDWLSFVSSTEADTALAGEQDVRLAALRFGVHAWASEQIAAARRGDISLSDADLTILKDSLSSPVTHRQVIDKALAEGLPVPPNALSAYPDLSSGRRVNEFQAPYQPASASGQSSTMIPINMAGPTYAALNRLETQVGSIDTYVADNLQYRVEDLPALFSPEQIDALGLAIKSVEEGRGMINADQTGVGKGRWVAAMLRYARLQGKTPVFVTIKPELFTDIFRDISDIDSMDVFNKVFVMNTGVNIMRFGTDERLFPATSKADLDAAIKSGRVEDDVDLVVTTYSQLQRAIEKNPKARLLGSICRDNAMLLMDEAHVAAGESNIGLSMTECVASADAVLYASATPLKGVDNFNIYNKIFPASVDLKTLPETLKTGGEALMEAISANMSRDGALIRREHDFSNLTFDTVFPNKLLKSRNVDLADRASEIYSQMSFLAGDVKRKVGILNKEFVKDFESIPLSARDGSRMQAASFNFGSRLYNLNRQFLLGIKIDQAIEQGIDDLEQGRKPVWAVENTGASLTQELIDRRFGLDVLTEKMKAVRAQPESEARSAELAELSEQYSQGLAGAVLPELPQFRDLLEIMLDRLDVITVTGRYGDVTKEPITDEKFLAGMEKLREQIREFPDLPLTAIDAIHDRMASAGYNMAEVSGRTMSLSRRPDGQFDVNYHPKPNGVEQVAGFQSGKYDGIVITRSGSTGISLHATDRFENSDIRQRDFIVLQKASNIAEFLQWLGRVNRKDQVIAPVITSIESGLPAEARLTMMHNLKLRKLSANTTSNRDNANIEGEDCDFLNDVGDRVAFEWLCENPSVADHLDIEIKENDETDDLAENYYINRLMARLPLLLVEEQEQIIASISMRFNEEIENLTRLGINPFKVDVHDWRASEVSEEVLQNASIRPTDSTFDEPVKLVKLAYDVDIHPLRIDRIQEMIKVGEDSYLFDLDGWSEPTEWITMMRSVEDASLFKQLPSAIREAHADDVDSRPSARSLIAKHPEAKGARASMEKLDWLYVNLRGFKPGMPFVYDDIDKGAMTGLITSVTFPDDDDWNMLSCYRLKAVFPGDQSTRDLTLASIRAQNRPLIEPGYRRVSSDEFVNPPVMRAEYIKKIKDCFDEMPDGRRTLHQFVLRGNIFRACELAAQQNLGRAVLYTDADGTRQRAIKLKERVTPEMVKSLPLGLDALDMARYTERYLDPKHPAFSDRVDIDGFRMFNTAVKDAAEGDGIMIRVAQRGQKFVLTFPGAKMKNGGLSVDGALFNIGDDTPKGSLGLEHDGNRKVTRCAFDAAQLPEVLQALQKGNYVSKFYVADTDPDIIDDLRKVAKSEFEAQQRKQARKERRAEARAQKLNDSDVDEDEPPM